MQRFLRWLTKRKNADRQSPNPSALQCNLETQHTRAGRKKPSVAPAQYANDVIGRIDDGGPGKNVLVRPRYVREDTGTHETLKIINDSLQDQDEDSGIDPYNSGRFDRAKSWASYRSRK